jgi:hypothetical protein
VLPTWLPTSSGHLHLNIQLIGLPLTQVDLTLTDDLFLYLFGMLSRFGLLIRNGAFIQAKGKENRLHRASGGKQSEHQGHHPRRVFESIQRRPDGLREGLFARMAFVAALFV